MKYTLSIHLAKAIACCAVLVFLGFAIYPASANQVCGKASWYSFDGQKTASGELADPDTMTAAHPNLPFGTRVKVRNMTNGREVTVRINDRGPYAGNRIIDVARIAAVRLGFKNAGLARVCISASGV